MKRWISSMLALIVALSLVLSGAAPAALSEEAEEVVSECIDPEVPLATEIEADGLFIEIGDMEIVEDAEAPEPEAPQAPAARYGRANAEALISDDAGAPLARIAEGSVVLILGNADRGLRVAFDTDRGAFSGCAAADSISLMAEDETSAFLDALVASGAVNLYNGDLNTPLAPVACEFIEAEAPAEDIAEPEAVEPAEEPETIETAEEPEAVEGAEKPEAVEAAEEPETIEPAEEPEIVEPAEELLDILGVEANGVEDDGEEIVDALANVSSLFDISERSAEVVVGDTHVIEAVANDGSAIDGEELIFASSNAAVASVDENGVVTANQSGSANITVTYQGDVLTSAINVPNEPDSISLNAAKGTIGLKETYTKLAVLMQPAGTAASVTWRSSNKKYVTVDQDGGIRGVKKGSAYVYARTRNGKEARCKITVKKAPGKVTVDKKLIVGEGQTKSLKAKLPSGTASASIRWESTNEKVATVDESGAVTGVSAGTAVIRVWTYNNKHADCAVTVRPRPTGISLNAQSLNMIVKGTATLKAAMIPGDAVAANTFSSSDPSVAAVNASGKVTAKKLGTAVITVTSYNGVQASCTISVLPTPKKVRLDRTKLTMGVGMQDALVATIEPADADPTLRWASSNSKVVRVVDGGLTALKTGSATITCKTSNGKKATCKVTVKAQPKSITLSVQALRLSAGGMQFRLTGKFAPKNAAGTISFTSSNPGVASVDASGTITTGNPGVADIIATAYNGVKASCALTVTPKPARASFAQTEVSIIPKQSYTPEVAVQAADGSDAYTTLTYEVVSNGGCIKLDAKSGKITGVKAGTAVVNVRTHNSVTAATPLTVKVVPQPTGVSLSNTSGTLGVGEKYTLKATLKGPAGCGSDLTWKSTNPKIVSVQPDAADGTCLITGVATGTATVSVTTANKKSASCKVTVRKAPNKLTLKASGSSVYIGSVVTCTVTLPSGTAGAYTISSSNESVLASTGDKKFTAMAEGTATLTATAYNNASASVTVTVKKVSGELTAEQNQIVEKVVSLAMAQLGKKYIYGSGYKTKNPSGFDCSGLTYWCYYYGAGVTLGNSAYRQGHDSKYASKRVTGGWKNLRRGDIVCFKNDYQDNVTHVGMYLGDGVFIHASSGGGKVQYGYFNKGNNASYYNRNLKWGYHVIGD